MQFFLEKSKPKLRLAFLLYVKLSEFYYVLFRMVKKLVYAFFFFLSAKLERYSIASLNVGKCKTNGRTALVRVSICFCIPLTEVYSFISNGSTDGYLSA